jgi:hypothetical protein
VVGFEARSNGSFLQALGEHHMPMRFVFAVVLFILMMVLAISHDFSYFGNALDILLALGVMLALCIFALWPNSSRADRVDRAMNADSWADRVKFEGRQEKE